jgi:hypothetical protein
MANQKCSKCHIQLIDVPRPDSGGAAPERRPIDLSATSLAEVDWSAVDGATVDWSRVDPSRLDWRRVDWPTINASGWSIVDPHIPDRWMAMASFSHDAHRFVSCLRCHAQADPAGGPSPTAGPDVSPSLKATGATKDIMMPLISDCRTCHAPAVDDGVGARSDCTLCHDYHGR